MFSGRSRFETSPNALARAVQRRCESGGDLLDLTESNPTHVGLGFPAQALRQALEHPRAGAYEPDALGLLDARQAIADYLAAQGTQVSPERIVVTASTSEAYGFLFKLLADPGDEVLVPAPSYPLFDFLAALESARPVAYPLAYDGEWHLDRGALAEVARPRARAVVVVNPNNPTGSFLKRDELAFLGEFCRERGLALLSDEVFSDYAMGPDPLRAQSALGQREALAFALGGLSKAVAAPQLKVGWIAVGGPEPLAAQAMERLEIIADTYLSASGPSQRAVPRILADRVLAQRPLRERLAQNLAALRALRPPAAPWEPLRVEGGWTAVLKIPRARSEQEWATMLVEEQGVLVHPGFFYDFPREGYLALSLIVEPGVFKEAILRLANCFGG